MTPQIPHMVLFGAANQNFSRPYKLVAQTHAYDAKLTGTIPTKNQSHRQSQAQNENRNRQHGKRFSLEQQRPVDRLFPGGPDKVERPTKKGSSHGNPGEMNVGRHFVGVYGGIVWNRLDRCPENLGIPKFFAGCRAARRKPDYGVMGRIYNDPAVIDQDLDHDMFGLPVLIQQEKAARMQAAALGKVHERVARRAANFQELPIIESVLRVTRVKRVRVLCGAAYRTVLHPREYGLVFFLGFIGKTDNAVGKTFHLTARFRTGRSPGRASRTRPVPPRYCRNSHSAKAGRTNPHPDTGPTWRRHTAVP